MSYEIIIDKKEKKYDVLEVCTVGYWFNKNELIKDVLKDFRFDIIMIDHLYIDNPDKVKDARVEYLESLGYKKAYLGYEIQFLASKASDAKQKKRR